MMLRRDGGVMLPSGDPRASRLQFEHPSHAQPRTDTGRTKGDRAQCEASRAAGGASQHLSGRFRVVSVKTEEPK